MSKLDIKSEMKAIDTKDRSWYNKPYRRRKVS